MSVDALYDINSKNDMQLNEGDEEDCLGDFCQHQPSFDDINEIATKLKEISVTMAGWEKSFAGVPKDVDDAPNKLREAFRKSNNLKVDQQLMNQRQTSICAFFIKLKKD